MDARPIKVAQFVVTTEACGWLVDQLCLLRDKFGYEVCAILPGSEGSLPDRLRALGIPVLACPLDIPSFWKLWTIPAQVAGLSRLLARERIDVFQTQVFLSTIFGRVAAWIAGVPVRLAMIAGPFHLDAPVSREIERRTWWMDTALLTGCEYSHRVCREIGVPEGRLRLVYYGTDHTRFDPAAPYPGDLRKDLGLPADCPVVGMVSYFYAGPPNEQVPWDLGLGWWPAGLTESPKGHSYLLRAIPQVLKKLPRCKFVLVGRPWQTAGEATEREMRALVEELGIRDSVIFAGYVPDIRTAYHGFDVVVEPSLSECLNGSVEALLMATPTIASRTGGLPDTVRHGETGLLVSPKNPDELAAAILELLGDREKAARLAANGRQLMLERFTLDRTAEDLHAVYTELLTRRGRARSRPLGAWLRRWLAVPLFHFISWRVLPQSDQGWFRAAARVPPRPVPLPKWKLDPRPAVARMWGGVRSCLSVLYWTCRNFASRVLPAPVKRAIRRVIPR